MPFLSAFGSGSTRSHLFNNHAKAVYGEARFMTRGDHSWTVPDGVTSVNVLCIGGGGHGAWNTSPYGGSGGGLAWQNDVIVTPGEVIGIVVGHGGDSTSTSQQSFSTGNDGTASKFDSTGENIYANGGSGGHRPAAGGTWNSSGSQLGVTHGGGTGGLCPDTSSYGGAGAGGYSGNGGASGGYNTDGSAGAGGGGGGASGSGNSGDYGASGGGTGIYGEGASGAGGIKNPAGPDASAGPNSMGLGGSGGTDGTSPSNSLTDHFDGGGQFGGGGGGSDNGTRANAAPGGDGIVRVLWGFRAGDIGVWPNGTLDSATFASNITVY